MPEGLYRRIGIKQSNHDQDKNGTMIPPSLDGPTSVMETGDRMHRTDGEKAKILVQSEFIDVPSYHDVELVGFRFGGLLLKLLVVAS